MKKKLDSRIPALIQNNVQELHRSFFVLVGDKGKDQVVTLHYLLSKARVSSRPSVLWCYKKELGFSSNRKKRMNQIKKEVARGIREADDEDPFELFVSSTNIRYAYYKETDKILGQTFGMCVLQDFEALTPNLLARTIETVEGGGIVVLLLKTMSSLKQLYTLTMDVHARYRTEQHQDTVARFNERFILSLGACETCMVLDDELNVLPLSAGKNVKPLPRKEDEELTKEAQELKELKESLKETQPVGSIVQVAKTVDQAKAVLTFVEAVAEKTLKSTVTLTAGRGRGKSAALGLSIASAVAYGYSNIFITSPSPENLKTLFEFVFKGFDALGYEEHLDYDIIQSTNPEFQKAVVRVNIFKDHRQTIQWIQPSDHQVLAQAELLVIDEAAAIPLPIVKKLMGPYLVFMASTINGYEGTGRSLSLKLIQQLREQSTKNKTENARSLREIKLEEPIRYAPGDQVEQWLNKLLCLDCQTPNKKLAAGMPHPSQCELYYVTRDTLFSYHPVSEQFLQMMMSLYVASHYKNSPNDLQLMSDAPAHHLFVLLPPIEKQNTLPEPLVVIQLAMEGSIARGSALASLARGHRANGDLIPWVVTQQFQDDDFASLSGARVVRIATHPNYIGMGYGARALEQLEAYYKGELFSLDEQPKSIPDEIQRVSEEELQNASLSTDKVQVRDPRSMPPLLLKLTERPPKERLDWLGVSFGVTQQLHKFWKRSGYTPVYLRQTANDLTGEHTCVMLKQLDTQSWLNQFQWDFRKRFLNLLGYQFRDFHPQLVLGILDACGLGNPKLRLQGPEAPLIQDEGSVSRFMTPFDLKRLESYSQNLLDYHVIMDLVPTIAHLYFLDLLHAHEHIKLSAIQACTLAALGLQKKNVEDVEKDMGISVSQLLALFGKSIKRISNFLNAVVEKQVQDQVNAQLQPSSVGKDATDDKEWEPAQKTLDEDLDEAADEAMEAFRQKQKELISTLALDQYQITAPDSEFQNAKMAGSKIVSVKSDKSSKKRKIEEGQRTSEMLIQKNTSQIVDPNNIIAKKKQKKVQKQQRRDAKKQQQ
ncbi:GNAT acetyltransferase 2-domain-containing protein [Gorgonomyces haynaldii]|nr:GNAT acetyltransferase 2-domain-containing protein [Gorgonomyces haynaldii]